MKLTFQKSAIPNWYRIEPEEQPDETDPLFNLYVAGKTADMQAIAQAIDSRKPIYFKLCAVNITSEGVVAFWSPGLNGWHSKEDQQCLRVGELQYTATLEEADELSILIKKTLGVSESPSEEKKVTRRWP